MGFQEKYNNVGMSKKNNLKESKTKIYKSRIKMDHFPKHLEIDFTLRNMIFRSNIWVLEDYKKIFV